MTVGTRIEFRRDTAANWTSANPTLLAGEPGFETDTSKLKFGDGSTAWTSLAYYSTYTSPSHGVLTSAVATSGTGDTALFTSTAFAANTLVSGSALKIRIAGVPSTTGTLTFKVHIGTAGTVSDAAVLTTATTAASAGANRWVDIDSLIVVRTNGSSGTAIGSALGVNQTGNATILNAIAAPATVTVDTTQANFLTASCACSTGNFTAELGNASQAA